MSLLVFKVFSILCVSITYDIHEDTTYNKIHYIYFYYILKRYFKYILINIKKVTLYIFISIYT